MPFADSHDYAEFKGVSDTFDAAERTRIDAGLLRAEDDVRAAITSGYDPNAERITTALTRATCAAFDYTEETGDDTGAQALYNATSIGSLSLTRSTTLAGQASAGSQRTSPRMMTILTNAGLRSQIIGYV